MRFAKKKGDIIVRACRLGSGTKLERELLASGKLFLRSDGKYEVFSQEAKEGQGEIACPGDYVKIDTDGYPYPNERSFFEQYHYQIREDGFRQKSRPVATWQIGDPSCEAIAFLHQTGRLEIHEEDDAQYFKAELWGAPLSAAKDAVIVFYSIERDELGTILDVDFNFVARSEFERTYEWCE